MFEGITNTVVMVFFGLLIGVFLGLFMILSEPLEPDRQQRSLSLMKKAGEHFSRYLRRILTEVNVYADWGSEFIHIAPKSLMIVYVTLLAFVVILVVTVIVTPLQMNWLAFLLSLFAAFSVSQLVYNGAKKAEI